MLLYAAVANQDVSCSMAGEPLPPPQLPQPLEMARYTASTGLRPLEGIKIGVFDRWFNDSDGEVLSCCRAAIDAAVAMGAELVPIAIPELELLRVAHTVRSRERSQEKWMF